MNRILNFISGCLIIACFASCNTATPNTSGAVALATSDLDSLLGVYSSQKGEKLELDYNFTVDTTMTDKSFGYRIDGESIEFFGGDHIAATHGVYTFLGELGFNFDLGGVSTAQELKHIDNISHDTLIVPEVPWRGIRQHVNFPMDISSYTIEDATKYIDDLLRMRFNKLTIHSYPGQWYQTIQGDSTLYAGNFFYGNQHVIYNNDLLREVVPENDTLICIPDAEKLRHDSPRLSQFAIDWMSQLIARAKALGIYVQFSFETRTDSPERAMEIAKDVYATYPTIDALELISEETGGWGKGCTQEQVMATLDRMFAPEIANNPEVLKPILPKQTDLNYLYQQIGANSAAIRELHKDASFDGVELKLGIYCSITRYSEAAFRLARLSLPSTKICVLSSHGSDGVARAIPTIIKSKEDLENSEIYSWIEFDGLMYLLQNSINGNEKLLQEIDSMQGKQTLATSILYNHWRTAENITSAAFVANSTIKPYSGTDDFYKLYAHRYGIGDTEKYTRAMKIINQVDSYSTKALGNIGFCWMGAWRSGGSYAWMSVENIEKARAMYLEAGNLFSELIQEAPKGSNQYNYLAFLGNRTLCSIIYLDAFKEATAIRTIKQNSDGTVSPSQQKRALEICNHALLVFDKYMETHAQMMPDRGCKGTLVSVWNAPIKGLRVLRSKFAGVPLDELASSDKAIDAPPLPIFYDNLSQ